MICDLSELMLYKCIYVSTVSSSSGIVCVRACAHGCVCVCVQIVQARLLRHKLVILVTHQLHYTKQANDALVIREVNFLLNYTIWIEDSFEGNCARLWNIWLSCKKWSRSIRIVKNEEDKVEKPEVHFKSPLLLPAFDRLMSTRSDRLTVDTPTGEGYIQDIKTDYRICW